MARTALRCRPTKPTPAPLRPDLGERERRFVYSVAMKYVKNADAAEDVTQDAMLLAHRHRAGFRGDSRYSTWLYRVAATTALMYLRRQRRLLRELSVDDRGEDGPSAPEPIDVSPGPIDRCDARERIAHLGAALAELGDKYREVFRMRFVEEMTDGEVAGALGVEVSTVKTRAHRARKAVREALNRLSA